MKRDLIAPEFEVRFLIEAGRNGMEFKWDVNLLLRADEVPSAQLGGRGRLGWTMWVGSRRTRQPARDLRLDPERDCERFPASG